MTLSSSRRRVRLWFGPHQIADFIGEAAHADRYEAAMRRRFPGLQITNDVLTARSPSAPGRQVFGDYFNS